MQHALKTDRQRLALLAFLHPDARRRETEEGTVLTLHARHIREYANSIATENGFPVIKDIGGVLTAFTQGGKRKAWGFYVRAEEMARAPTIA